MFFRGRRSVKSAGVGFWMQATWHATQWLSHHVARRFVQTLLRAAPDWTSLRRRQSLTPEDLRRKSRLRREGEDHLGRPARRCSLNKWGKQGTVLRVLALGKFRQGVVEWRQKVCDRDRNRTTGAICLRAGRRLRITWARPSVPFNAGRRAKAFRFDGYGATQRRNCRVLML